MGIVSATIIGRPTQKKWILDSAGYWEWPSLGHISTGEAEKSALLHNNPQPGSCPWDFGITNGKF